jgi:hypothetical protein
MIGMGTNLYVVSGSELYAVTSAGVSTLLGTIDGGGISSMAHNGTQVCIISGTYSYSANLAGVSTLAIAQCAGVAVQDGYGIFAESNSQRFFISAINDFTTFDGTEFALANAVPDNLTGIVNVNRETWLFGEKTVQVYYNSGNPDFPFSRIAAGVIQRGTNSPRTICQNQGHVFWLGEDLRVYVSNGYQPEAISTHPIEREIATYISPEDASAFIYEQEGHTFYVLTFTERTWVFDVSTGLWHERVSETLDYWRARTYERYFGLHLVGDAVTGALYTLDLGAYTDDGSTIRRVAVSPPIHADTMFATMTEVRVDAETGVGLASGQGSDPQMMLRWSDDGGNTWSNEHWRSLGNIGYRGSRATWRRLGQFRQRCLELSVSDPVKVAILDVFVDAEGGVV